MTGRDAPVAERRVAAMWRDARGVSAIETALLMPAFLLFLLGICEFGRALWTQSALQYAVEAAARCAVVNSGSTCNSASATKSYAATEALGLSIPSGAFSVSGSCSGSMTVTASYSFGFVVPQLFPWTLSLAAKSAYPC